MSAKWCRHRNEGFCRWCQEERITQLQAELGRAAGSAKWNSEQYADCADKLKTTKAELDRYKAENERLRNCWICAKCGKTHVKPIAALGKK
jgi:hypothetical protein